MRRGKLQLRSIDFILVWDNFPGDTMIVCVLECDISIQSLGVWARVTHLGVKQRPQREGVKVKFSGDR